MLCLSLHDTEADLSYSPSSYSNTSPLCLTHHPHPCSPCCVAGVDSSGGIGSSLMLATQSPLQALVTCTVPRELQEDIQELGECAARTRKYEIGDLQ